MKPYSLGKNLFLRDAGHLTPEEDIAWDFLLLSKPHLKRAFLSRAYINAVASTGRIVKILIGYEGKQPIFFFPLQRKSGVLGKLGLYEPVGDIMSDYFGIIANAGVRVDIQYLLKATKGSINAILFNHLEESQSQHGLIAEEHRLGLRTCLGHSAQEYWSNLRISDKKLVYDTERREKKLIAELGPLVFEWASTQPKTDLDWLIQAKNSQYSRTGKKSGPLFELSNIELLRTLLETDDPMCRAQLSVLRCGTTTIAGHFGLRCGSMLHVWFPVYNYQLANYSPGRILFKHMFLTAASEGVDTFDRGEGDNQAKRDFANFEHRLGRGFWVAKSCRGKIANIAQRILWKFT